MKYNKEKIRIILIMNLIFIIGFAARTTVALKTVFNQLEKHNIRIESLY